jgi:hypothetical protein
MTQTFSYTGTADAGIPHSFCLYLHNIKVPLLRETLLYTLVRCQHHFPPRGSAQDTSS